MRARDIFLFAQMVYFAFGKSVVGLVKWLAVEMNSSPEIG
jgi:hypothetical protein